MKNKVEYLEFLDIEYDKKWTTLDLFKEIKRLYSITLPTAPKAYSATFLSPIALPLLFTGQKTVKEGLRPLKRSQNSFADTFSIWPSPLMCTILFLPT